MKHLVLGGVKSGKSQFAEDCAQASLDAGKCSSVTVIATAQALDEAMTQRIERHKASRPDNWDVIEEPLSLADALSSKALDGSFVIVDCLTLWLTNLLMLEDDSRLDSELDKLKVVIKEYPHDIVIVSNETNMGIMPLGNLTRRYCDLAGCLHKDLASLCERVDLMVAGLPLSLKAS